MFKKNNKLKSRLGKHNAIFLVCYDVIKPEILSLYKKWIKDGRLQISDRRVKYLGQYIYQIEFCGDISLLKEDLEKINPRFLKKIPIIKRILNYGKKILCEILQK